MRHESLHDRLTLTDGGVETDLIFNRGIDLPFFASVLLLRTPEGEKALEDYIRPYLELARRLGVTDRHLRRIFEAQFGVSPLQYLQTRRLLTAKQLLADTALPVTQVALASGFGSLRRFNDAFRSAYRMAPRELRRNREERASTTNEALTLRLGYRPPYDFAAMLDFLRGRALPGVEVVDECSYSRVIGPVEQPGQIVNARIGRARAAATISQKSGWMVGSPPDSWTRSGSPSAFTTVSSIASTSASGAASGTRLLTLSTVLDASALLSDTVSPAFASAGRSPTWVLTIFSMKAWRLARSSATASTSLR